MHALGYVHCDLKPDNVLLKGEDEASCREIVLIDFGLSQTYLVSQDGEQKTRQVAMNISMPLSGKLEYPVISNLAQGSSLPHIREDKKLNKKMEETQ